MFHGSTVLGPIIAIGIGLRGDITTRSAEVEVSLLHADKESLTKHVRCNLDVCPELMSRLPDFDPS
jgi:hypothetical protein